MNRGKTQGAVIYTRVSTGEQAEHGTSLAGQREVCLRKAGDLGLPVTAEYEDAGISGGLLLSRVGLQAALGEIHAGRADTLICANLSRFSRDAEHQHALKREIEAAGVRVVFCDMAFDDTPEGDLAYGIMGNFAAYEKAVIKARTMRGKRRRAEEGQQPQRSRPPFGYHVVTNAEVAAGIQPPEMRGRYQVDPEKAPIAQRLFAEYLQGATLSRLALLFNREGIPAPGGGSRWMPATVRVILTNPVYKGEPVSGRQKCSVDERRLTDFHKLTGRPITTPEVRRLVPEEERLKLSAPALVSREDWDAVQARMAQNRDTLKGDPRRALMLSGKTLCPHCGGRAVLKYQKANGKRYTYLTCAEQRRAATLNGEKRCSTDLYPLAFMEECTVRVILEVCEKPDALAAAEWVYAQEEARAVKAQDPATLQAELARWDKALQGLAAEQDAAVRAQVAGILAGASPDAYAPLFADLAARRKDLEDRRGQLLSLLSAKPAAPAAPLQVVSAPLHQILRDAHRVLTDPEVAGVTKRDILLPIVEEVICHKDGVEVLFTPGLFELGSETEGKDRELIDYTTCMVVRVRNGADTWGTLSF